MSVGPCPHDWLLPKCSAVVHHGGAGTTAAGLRFGLPTLVCPFFGDQFMWGEMVRRAGVGPAPCPVEELTDEILATKLSEMLSLEIKNKAKLMSEQMAQEDGILGGLDHFLSSLPRDNMFCDVSLLLGETKLAKVHLEGSSLKVSLEVASLLILDKQGNFTNQPESRARPLVDLGKLYEHWQRSKRYGSFQMTTHAVMNYAIGRVETFAQGCWVGWIGWFLNALRSPCQLFTKPDKYARSHGAFGCLWGLLVAPFFIVMYVLYAFVILVDRIVTGTCNGCFQKQYLYFWDTSSLHHVHSKANVLVKVESMAQEGLRKSRKKELFRGLEMAVAARNLFDRASPKFPPEHWHFQVVAAGVVKQFVPTLEDSYLKFSPGETSLLEHELDLLGEGTALSFSRLCSMLRQIITNRSEETERLQEKQIKMRSASRAPSMAELFLTDEEMEHLTTNYERRWNLKTTKTA
jgi:hypothetical protein